MASKKPIILKRMIIKGTTLPIKDKKVNHNLIKLATLPLYREDVIFESKGESFIGDYLSITITNKLNNLTNNCQTLAHCVTASHEIIVKTSDNVTQIIGPEAYNSVFYALCSVINQEYRIKAILSLLTVKDIKLEKMGLSKACQTDETRIVLKTKQPRRHVRRVPIPYAVKPDEATLKKVIVPNISNAAPKNMGTACLNSDLIPKPETSNVTREKTLPDLGYLQDDSNDSIKSFSTLHSFNTIPDLLLNPISLVDNVEKHTQEIVKHPVVLTDGTELWLPSKPEDMFHIATPENLQYLDEVSKKKILLHQMQIDLKHCCSLRDEDGNLPIHLAVINNDISLLKRQCAVLNIKKQSVDITTTNGLTPLKLSIFCESADATSLLLRHGADPLLEEEGRSAAHLAAELRTEHLQHVLNHCRVHARSIIAHHAEELQTPGWQTRSDEELASTVLQHVCSSYDKQGYTPLMLASKLGLYENVRLLADCWPPAAQLKMPTSGDTALYLAVSAACTASAERGNKSKVVDHFRKTIEILLDAGADPSVDNNYGSNVNVILQEFNCAELSMLVANKITHNRFYDEDTTRNFDEFVIMKDGDKVSIQEIKKNGRNKLTKDNESQVKIEDVTKSVGKSDVEKSVVKNVMKSDFEDNTKLKNINDLVAKGFVKLFTKTVKSEPSNVKIDKSRKPVITENILIKKPKDTKKPIKKVIFYPNKRKNDDNDSKNVKIKKV